MSGIATKKNVGHLVAGRTARTGVAPALIVAAGAGDNALIVGSIVDTIGFESAVLVVPCRASLGAAETLSLAVQIEESGDGVAFDAPVVLQASAVLLTGGGGGTDEAGMLKLNLDELGNRKRFARIGVTPDLSAGGVDTAIVEPGLLLGGAEVLPAS